MAASFPYLATYADGARTTDATSHTVTMPASVAVGDLLVVVVCFDGNPTVTWPAGWNVDHAGACASSAARVEAASRIADGTEGASISIGTSASEMFAYYALRIPNGAAVESSTGVTGTSSAPDPDSISPTWGADDNGTLYLSICGYNNGTNYHNSNGVGQVGIHVGSTSGNGPNQRADNSAGCGLIVYNAVTRSASHNPPAHNLNGSREWRAFTLAIQSTGGSGGSGGGTRIYGWG